MGKWDKLATKSMIEKAVSALKGNGIDVHVVDTGEEARKKVFEMIPEGTELMNMTSATLEETDIAKEIMDSGRFDSIRKKVYSTDGKIQERDRQKLRSSPEWAIGSANAVTEDGKVLFASGTGSQLPAYAYGSSRVIWVVGSQKIVKDVDEGTKRIYEYCLPLESERLRKAFGVPGSSVSKILIINKERPGRITMILVKEKLGF